MLHIPPIPSQAIPRSLSLKPVVAQSVAHLPRKARIEMAIGLVDGCVEVAKWTTRAAARFCDVPAAVISTKRGTRRARARSPQEILSRLVRDIGADKVLDLLIQTIG